MENTKPAFNKDMLAYCGLYCELCSFKTAHDERDPRHLDAVPYAFERQALGAYDCENWKGHCICGPCAIKDCASQKDIDSCADCADFPCVFIAEFETDGKPHHREGIGNLRMIRARGTDAWFAAIAPTLRCAACGQKQSWYYRCDQHE